jgi:hypothetical protein
LDSSNKPYPGYNSEGRGYPDIALLGVSYNVVVGGVITQLYGTSCSTPVMAGLGRNMTFKTLENTIVEVLINEYVNVNSVLAEFKSITSRKIISWLAKSYILL